MPLPAFRTKIKEYLHQAGYTQKQLAYALGWHPTLLSNTLNAPNFAHLTHTEKQRTFDNGGLNTDPSHWEVIHPPNSRLPHM